jgi:hypothetical protein
VRDGLVLSVTDGIWSVMSHSRRLAWIMLAGCGLHILVRSGSKAILYWPMMIAGDTAFPYALLCFALSGGLFLNWLTNRRSDGGAGLSFTLSVLAVFLAFIASFPGVVHGATASLDGRTYHLAFLPRLDRDDVCLLYECDSMDVVCTPRRTSVHYMVDPGKAKLVADARAHAVYVQLGDEVFMRYSPASGGK